MKNIYSIPTILLLLFSVTLFGQLRVWPPDLRAPEDTETGQNPNVILDWDAVTGETLDITYEAQIATMEDFSDAVTFPRTDLSAQVTTELTFGQMYYWRVKAFDADDPSGWSETWSFSVLETVTVNEPGIGDEVYANPIVEWDEVTGILEYELQIDTTYVWNIKNTGTTEDVQGTFVLDENNMWLVGNGGLVQYFNGSEWSTIDVGVTEDLLSVFFVNSTTGYVVGNNGSVVYYNGTDWASLDAGATVNLTGVYFLDADNGWVVGDDGVVLRYNTGTWTTETSNTENDLTGVFALSASDVWACGLKKTILHFDGTEWMSSQVGLVDLYSIWFNDASNGWVSGKSGKVNYYDGTEWTDQSTGTTKHLYGISMSGNTGYAAGKDGAMVYYENESWTVVTSGVSVDLNGIWLKGDLGLAGGLEGTVISKAGAGFDSPFMHVFKIPNDTTEYQLEFLPFGSNIYYRMRTSHAKDTCEWSSARSMYTQAAPELDKPNNGSSDADLLTLFRWKEYDGAVDYIFQIDDNENFETPYETFVDSTSVNYLMSIFDKTYSWRVKAQHPLDVSDWSEVYTLTTVADVTLISPDDGETEVPSCPKYEWEEIVGAKAYQIMVDVNEDFSDPMTEETEIPSYQCQSPLPKKTVYYWKVRSIASLDTSAWSPVWSFQTEGFIGIEDEFAADAIEIYPNPNDGTFSLDVNSLTQDTYHISVTDLTGRMIMEESVLLGSGNNSLDYSIGDLEKGIYLLQVRKGEASITKKIFIR